MATTTKISSSASTGVKSRKGPLPSTKDKSRKDLSATSVPNPELTLNSSIAEQIEQHKSLNHDDDDDIFIEASTFELSILQVARKLVEELESLLTAPNVRFTIADSSNVRNIVRKFESLVVEQSITQARQECKTEELQRQISSLQEQLSSRQLTREHFESPGVLDHPPHTVETYASMTEKNVNPWVTVPRRGRKTSVTPPTGFHPAVPPLLSSSGAPVQHGDKRQSKPRSQTRSNRSRVDDSDRVLIVYPSDKSVSSDSLKADLAKSINPSALGIGVSSFRTCRNNGVVFKLSTSEALATLKTHVSDSPALKDRIELVTPSKSNPKLLILGVDSTITKENLINVIFQQNTLPFDNTALVVRFPLTGKSQTTNWVIECTPESFAHLKKLHKIHIGWTNCFVKEFFGIPRCHKCSLLGHTQTNCSSPHLSCSLCGGKHSYTNCKSATLVCQNCTKANATHHTNLDTAHSSFDFSCPCYKREVDIRKNRTNYILISPTTPSVNPSND